MAIVYGPKNYGLYVNGDLEYGNTYNWTAASGGMPSYSGNTSIYSTDAYRGNYSLKVSTAYAYAPTFISDNFVEVDTTQYYVFSLMGRTLTRSSPNNYHGQGYTGIACYDQFYNPIYLPMCYQGNGTTLSRALNPGDSYAYITSSTGWNTSSSYYYRHLMINPATHPYYSTPYGYTRIGQGDYDLYYNQTITYTGTDYRLTLQDYAGNAITMPNIGYSLPIGTPVFNGLDGGTYNYNINSGYSVFTGSWARYTSGVITGTSYDSSVAFRQGTKYIKFMMLPNYNVYTETTPPTFLLDDILAMKSPTSRTYTLP